MALLLALWRLVGWRGLLVGISMAFAIYWHSSRVSEAYDDGAQTVRIEWQESRRRAELAALERQKRQQMEVSKIEAELITVQTQDAIRRRALEEALEAERIANDKTGNDRSVCRLPDGVRDALRY